MASFWNPRFLAPAMMLVIAGVTGGVRAETASWTEPDIDTWSYVNGFLPGSRTFAPSFSNLAVDEATGEFFTNNNQDPARLASMLIAFETSDEIEAGLSPSRYQVNSVTITSRIASGTIGALLYEDQAVTPNELLSAANGSGITAQLPFELFGVGFRDGYDGFALGPDQSGTRFAESTSVFSALDGGYVAHPIIGDGVGGTRDVTNNVTGGFSATEPGGSTAPFEATPWAIGSVAGLTPGNAIPNDSTVTFEVDLNQAGVVEYLQQALSDGALGFFVSTLHPTSQPGLPGAQPYPQWYTKEAVGTFAGAEAPTLSIDFTIIDEAFPPGDYDQSGDVGLEDYALWGSEFGAEVTPGTAADGNSSGVVDAADYAIWRDLTTASTPVVVAATIPEPPGLLIGIVIAGSLTASRWICVRPN